MRFLLYNILNGAPEAARLEGLLDFIRAQKADVVALCEVNGWQKPGLLAERSARAGFDHAYLFERRSPYLLGLFARQPITVMGEYDGEFHHGMAHLRLAECDIFLSHFAPHDAGRRLTEARKVSALLQPLTRPALVMGDLNSHSPHDRDLCEVFATVENSGWAMDFAAHQILLDAGLTDLGAREPLYPERWSTATALQPEEPRRRLDYVLANAAFVARYPRARAVALHEAEVETLSDHWPVRCDTE